jgi:hypothetical protein
MKTRQDDICERLHKARVRAWNKYWDLVEPHYRRQTELTDLLVRLARKGSII